MFLSAAPPMHVPRLFFPPNFLNKTYSLNATTLNLTLIVRTRQQETILTPNRSLDAQSVLRPPNAAAITPSKTNTARRRVLGSGTPSSSGARWVRRRGCRALISRSRGRRLIGGETEAKRGWQGCRGPLVQSRVGGLAGSRLLSRARPDGTHRTNGCGGRLGGHLPRGR